MDLKIGVWIALNLQFLSFCHYGCRFMPIMMDMSSYYEVEEYGGLSNHALMAVIWPPMSHKDNGICFSFVSSLAHDLHLD